MAVLIVTGAVDCGKTTWCRTVLLPSRAAPDGLLLPKVLVEGRRVGYDCRRVSSGQQRPFARLPGGPLPPGWREGARAGPFSVSRDGLQAARRWIRRAAAGDASTVLIDEVGPLELAGGGLAGAVRDALRRAGGKEIVLVVREGLLEAALRAFPVGRHRLLRLPPRK